MSRFEISWRSDSATYGVSKPNYGGGDVVDAVDFDELQYDHKHVQDLVIEAWFGWERLMEAKTLSDQASAINQMNNTMADLATWMPGWNVETGRIEGHDE